MSQTNLLDLAKQGDIDAISTLINRNLNPKGITAKVSKSSNCLRIMLDAQTVPIQSNLVNYIQNGVGKLEISQIDELKIFGRQTGDDVPAWSQSVNLREQVVQPSDLSEQPLQQLSSQPQQSDLRPTDSSFTTPKYKPSTLAGRITFIILGLSGLIGGLTFLVIPVLGWILGGMAIFASIAMITAGISGAGTLTGECPSCGAGVSEIESQQGFNCTSCKKRIVIRDRKFYRTD